MPIQIASPIGWVDEKGYPVTTKEHIDQLGISVAPDGSIICRYVNGEGQREAINLTAIIEQAADEAVKAHVRHLHGHSL